ncbi:hypothetical protein [Mycetocola manganoxydans]|uniref:hypothetical protein n=1 Tax=Mycetocola manganoxydans TaxID=699879 RepID=UPI0015FF49D9|nr:hypothetical protein [Mycetocola manganoxydans]GHD50857.1 hypothetical protein GCM10008097_25300 [Mycetocola manganoxydans]
MTSFKARVEQSSIGTPMSQAARRTVSTRTAAEIVKKANTSGQITVRKNPPKKLGGK